MGPVMRVACWVLVGSSGLFLGLRIYCKSLKKRGLWWDDYLLVAAWLALIGDVSVNTANLSLGFGMHTLDINPANLPTIGLLSHMSGSLALFGAVWSKTSFGMTMLRITEKGTKAAVWFIIVSMNLAMSINVLTTWIECNPIPKGWDKTINGICWDPKVNTYFGVFASVYSGLMDIVLALLPWMIIWKLQMRRKEKVGIAVAMSMGVFAGCAAFIKSSKIPLVLAGDFTYEGYDLVIWGVAEVSITIMATSIPLLRVLFREVRSITQKKYGAQVESASGDTYQRKSYGAGALQRASTVIVTADSYPWKMDLDPSSYPNTIQEDDRSSHSGDSPQKSSSGRIWQTQEITVQYHQRGAGDDMGPMV
ncbi:hypothetical protein B0H67DRAFT_632183 [Lasiosphaeris hirsuta]|uniref:Rhodopsin domain-containing protein n=1 Tax=Lasiosphaeris hirsuta TaxID=260670 RepID=A0AA40AZ27_9PEZI|nr:hypothetical protein B0H67DRAFT_632183 [Lasiosphaeris hirsuta]